MDKRTVSERVEGLKKAIDRKILLLHRQSIALNLFDTGLNKSLKIKSDVCFVEYFTRQDLVDDIKIKKLNLAIMIKRLKIANKQFGAIKLKESIKKQMIKKI